MKWLIPHKNYANKYILIHGFIAASILKMSAIKAEEQRVYNKIA